MQQPVLQRDELVFIKLGGSLITKKESPQTARLDTIQRLSLEIASARIQNPSLRILLGHGSGSFGHVPAHQHGTRQGVHSPAEWLGFLEVWGAAAQLNRIVQDTLRASGLPAISFPPSASIVAWDGQVESWELGPIRSAIKAGLIPVVFGDVVFDRQRGGTILSTEDLFDHLAFSLQPERIILAGIEPGVWKDFPANSQLVQEITPITLPGIVASLGGSMATDVTGGMASKVQQSLKLVQRVPGLSVEIISGEKSGFVQRALLGENMGTLIRTGR